MNTMGTQIDLHVDAHVDLTTAQWYLYCYGPRPRDESVSHQRYMTIQDARDAYMNNEVTWKRFL